MSEQEHRIRIQRDLRPTYYDDFHCIAQDCHISCCKGWSITFDKKDYLALKRQKGSQELNGRMERCMHRIHNNQAAAVYYAEFVLNDGACPLLREDHLCDLQIEKGHPALPHVCQFFPRIKEYMLSGYLERSLSLACEGVLNLLWNQPEGISFVSDPLDEKDQLTLTINSDQTNGFVGQFQNIRSWCIDMLQNRKYPLAERILRMGIALSKLVEGDGDVDYWLNTICPLTESQDFPTINSAKSNQMLPLFLSNNLRLLFTIGMPMDRQFQDFRADLIDAFKIKLKSEEEKDLVTAKISCVPWWESRKRYEESFSDKEYFMENVIVSLFFSLHMPNCTSDEALWKSFVNFCNFYSFYRFLTVMSCHEGSIVNRDTLFNAVVQASRVLIHSGNRQRHLQDQFFENDSATLAHMAVLLSN